MMKEDITTKNPRETKRLAGAMLEKLGSRNVVLLFGELGAGKTTFSQGLLKEAGAQGPFTSPTFVVMKHYPLSHPADSHFGRDQKKAVSRFRSIYHFDCYRVEEEDIRDMGWEEIIVDKNNLVIVEWPERIEKLWPKKYLHLSFSVTGKSERTIKVEER